jgi:hypothetical protein
MQLDLCHLKHKSWLLRIVLLVHYLLSVMMEKNLKYNNPAQSNDYSPKGNRRPIHEKHLSAANKS